MEALRFEGFSFAYPGGGAAVGPVDWPVPEGAFQLLVGATGSGKTTLLRCLKPAIAPAGARAGRAEVLGRAVDRLDAREAAALVGYVAQSPENQIVCDSVWHELAFGLENLGMPQPQMRRRVAEAAHFFGIEPWFRREVAELSGGQKQMVALASVLALRPRLLLLDEPTSQLDPVAEKNFLHALFRVNRELGITVVAATHAPEAMAAYATHAAQLHDGRVEEVPLDRFAARPLRPSSERGDESAPSCHPERSDEPAPSCHPERRREAPESKDPVWRQQEDPGLSPHGILRLRAARSAQDDKGGSAARFAQEPPAVSLRDAHARYRRGDDWVLRGADLDVRAGEVHALVGGNGCGKSTLLRLVAGVLKPERGRVANRLADRQALLPQDPKALFVCDTVEDELREWQAACGYGDAAVGQALARFGLAERARQHPFDLSGGQQQKLALAKLLLTNPALLLLDEPTKGLDAPSKLEVARILRERAHEGAAVLMATHDLAFAALVADEATMLFDGEAACTEPAAAFFAGNLFYRPVEDGFARLRRGEAS